MSKSKTKSIQTAYGETSIEVVECDSCGNEMSKEGARVFVTGDRLDEHFGDVKVKGDTKQGYICDYCDDSGPMSYPGSEFISRLYDSSKRLWYDYEHGGMHEGKVVTILGVLFMILLFAPLVLMVL